MSRKRLRDKVPQEGCSVSVASSSNIPCGRPGSYAGPIDRSLSCYRLAPSLSVSVYLPFSLSVCRFPFLTVCFCFRLQLPTHSECAELFANMRIVFRILFQTVCCGMCVWYSILQCPISAPSVPHAMPRNSALKDSYEKSHTRRPQVRSLKIINKSLNFALDPSARSF